MSSAAWEPSPFPAAQAMVPGPLSDVSPDADRVVAEYDVYLCNELHSLDAQLALLGYPLRPPWRPYPVEASSQVRYKKQAKRMEMDIELDKEMNYNQQADKSKRVDSVTLRSAPMAVSKGMLAYARVQGSKLLLMPIDMGLQLRPDMTYLDQAAEKDKAAGVKQEGQDFDEDEDEEGAGATAGATTTVTAATTSTLTAIEVQVKRRETERQQAARLNSYAYMHQQEQEEPWLRLDSFAEGTSLSRLYWDKATAGTSAVKQEPDVGMDSGSSGSPQPPKQPKAMPPLLSRKDYLLSFVPGSGGPETAIKLGATAPAAAAEPGPGSQADAAAATITPEMKAALGPVLKAMFSKHTVCNLADVRRWLREKCSGPAQQASSLPEKTLHEAVISSVGVVPIRRCYVLKATGHAATDPMRQVVVDLLKDAESVQKKDIASECAVQGVPMNDSVYGKVVKDLCTSHGNNWSLRNGADF